MESWETDERIADALAGRHAPKLVLLHTCKGGKVGSYKDYEGAAITLVKRDVPNVVALQHEIAMHEASAFVSRFYDAWCRQMSLEDAIKEAHAERYDGVRLLLLLAGCLCPARRRPLSAVPAVPAVYRRAAPTATGEPQSRPPATLEKPSGTAHLPPPMQPKFRRVSLLRRNLWIKSTTTDLPAPRRASTSRPANRSPSSRSPAIAHSRSASAVRDDGSYRLRVLCRCYREAALLGTNCRLRHARSSRSATPAQARTGRTSLSTSWSANSVRPATPDS